LVIMGVIYIGANLVKRSEEKGNFWRISHLLLGFIYLFAGIFVFSDLNAAAESLFVLIGIFVGISWIVDGIVTLTVLTRFAPI
ncbi:HdeD family acid-resistance protein, partial [Lactococcus lactis]